MVVTTGPVVDPEVLRAPANAEVHRFVPHAELMPRASLVVGHGGHGTTMQALAHDLPLVLMPMHPMLDQPMVATSVARAGAARVVPKKASAEDLRPVIAAMLADGPHRAAAARLGAEIRALPGAPGAADRIEALVVTPSRRKMTSCAGRRHRALIRRVVICARGRRLACAVFPARRPTLGSARPGRPERLLGGVG